MNCWRMQTWTADTIKESNEDHHATCTNCMVLNSVIVVANNDWKERLGRGFLERNEHIAMSIKPCAYAHMCILYTEAFE